MPQCASNISAYSLQNAQTIGRYCFGGTNNPDYLYYFCQYYENRRSYTILPREPKPRDADGADCGDDQPQPFAHPQGWDARYLQSGVCGRLSLSRYLRQGRGTHYVDDIISRTFPMQPPKVEDSTREERQAYVLDAWKCLHDCEACGKCRILKGRDAETLYADYIEGRRSYMDVTLEFRNRFMR